jgi:arylsulfatase A-like enzyme
MKKLLLGMAALTLAVVVGIVAWHRWQDRRINLVLITIDTLRADHLSAYGYPRATSPHFDALAKESILYRRAFSHASETNPSLSSLMTGHYPHETKVLRIVYRLPEGARTLAELLHEHGWRTGAVVSNSFLSRRSGFEQGFEDYDDELVEVKQKWPGPERGAQETTVAAIRWLRAHADEPFFLWVHYMDPHAPYLPPSPYDKVFAGEPLGKDRELVMLPPNERVGGIPQNSELGDHRSLQYYIAQYDGEIRYMDEWLGKLLDEVRALKLLEKTLFIVTADHGEGMGEHNHYFSHQEFVYTTLTHVPLLIRLPGPTRQGQQISIPVGLVDVMPTVLDLLQVRPPDSLANRSLLHPVPRPIPAVARSIPVQMSLVANSYKLNISNGLLQLYDLEQDHYETVDLLETNDGEHGEMAQEMRGVLERLLFQDTLHLGAPEIWALSPDDITRLKSLGYVQQ